jgi:hypothetical protein
MTEPNFFYGIIGGMESSYNAIICEVHSAPAIHELYENEEVYYQHDTELQHFQTTISQSSG